MAAVNLIRNSRVFFTTNIDSFGRVKIGPSAAAGVAQADASAPMTAANCFEIQVLEGMSFSQNTTVDTVTLNEAGAAPVRGQRSFNTALEPVDFTFSTYIRPHNTGSLITAEEQYLWNAFGGAANLGAAGAAWTSAASTGTVGFTNSNKHQLLPFGLIILFDNAGYVIDNCALDSATIDFGIDAIAAIAWAGKGSAIRVLDGAQANTASPVVFANVASATNFAGAAGANTALAKNTAARYITNKLSTLVVNDGINDFVTTAGGAVTAVTVGNNGSGYTSAPTVAFAAPTSGTTATGTAVLSGGAVTAVAVTNGGVGVAATGATIAFSAPQVVGGVTALGTVTVSGGVITGIVITTAGSGYTTAPTATLANLGTPTTAPVLGAVTIGTSTITGVTITNAGSGYITATPPAITFTGGGGTGAAATATVSAPTAGVVYTIALTGGNITFSNNLTYLTPANLGTVNLPITYFTGTRAITGTINAYLKTGSLESGGLLADLLAGSATTVDPKFTINVQLGGPSTNLTGVEIKLPAAMLQIPTINTEQVISTTINFTAQGYAGTNYDITESNEATIVYRAAA
jgi:hypothetical protein